MQINFTEIDGNDMSSPFNRPISPFREMGAYEALWDKAKVSFKSLAEMFRDPDSRPTDFVEPEIALNYANRVHSWLHDAGIQKYGIRVRGQFDYPVQLRIADNPVELLYYQGRFDLIHFPERSVSVVGTRNPSPEGILRTRKLVKSLVSDQYIIYSGMAAGIDTVAHETAIQQGGQTVGVLGTPLANYYPKENKKLQQSLASRFLLISQVPAIRYINMTDPKANRHFFPERNITMSALTAATILVEAGETSGSLIQARNALKQNKMVFILESNFKNPTLSWPKKFEQLGAKRVSDYAEIRHFLDSAKTKPN